MRAFILRITTGAHAGRYVGVRFGGGLVTNPDLQKTPPVNIPGTNFGPWAQDQAATRFFEPAITEAAAELTKLGYEVQIIQVQ